MSASRARAERSVNVSAGGTLSFADEADYRGWLSALFESFSYVPADLETLLAWRRKRSLIARPPGRFRLRRAQVAPVP